MTAKKKEKLTFEDAMEGLEASVASLRSDELSLEESLQEFRRGMEHYERCKELLTEAKKAVSVYTKESDTLEEF